MWLESKQNMIDNLLLSLQFSRKSGGACATGAITLQDRKTFNFDGQTQNHNQQKE